MMKQLPTVQVVADYVKFGGGLDLKTPALSIKPGYVIEAMNYEPDVFGGYRRIGGYERFDGRAAPSAATYYFVRILVSIGSPAVGDTITGGTSGATGTVAYINLSLIPIEYAWVALTEVAGTFVAGESYSGSGTGTLVTEPIARGCPDIEEDAKALNAAADIYRADITAVTGSDDIRGVWVYKGATYAFRDNVGATACVMWKSTGAGWSQVGLGFSLAFTSGGTYQIVVGNTITGATSGATAVITHVDLVSGTWAGGDAAGTLYFTTKVSNFQSENLNVGASLNVATIAGNASANVLSTGGRYEFVNYNFSGSTNTLYMYGCDGVNKAFQFDGTNYIPIRTGMAEDTPKFICAYRKMLFLGFRGSLQNSGVGNPFSWSVVTGANEYAAGDEITGLLVQPGEVLMISLRNSTYQFTGSSVANFVVSPLAAEMGAIPYTLQNVGTAYGMDDRGIVQYLRAQDYGNFNHDTVSRMIQPVIDRIQSDVKASVVHRSKNQYRVFAPDLSASTPTTYGVIMTLEKNKVVGFSEFTLPIWVTCACSGEDSDGKDVVFVGASNGRIYQFDKGSSFDGDAIESYLRMPFNNLRMPRHDKRYRKTVLEMECEGFTQLRFNPEFDYGNFDKAPHRLQSSESVGAGGYWDIDNWESFFYDAQIVASPEFSIEGTGLNMSLLFYSNTDIDLGHTLQGALIHYTIRRIRR